MDLNAQLDVDLVAVQAEDVVTCLLTLTAPIPEDVESRPGECLIAVVDRSGSMSGGRLAAVRTALHSLVDRLKPQDTLGVVAFDDQAVVQVPAR
ncbi:MAG: VWA domain-containing protein, partial [Candidatus Nanopelagicales bacterium]